MVEIEYLDVHWTYTELELYMFPVLEIVCSGMHLTYTK